MHSISPNGGGGGGGNGGADGGKGGGTLVDGGNGISSSSERSIQSISTPFGTPLVPLVAEAGSFTASPDLTGELV